MRIRFALKAVPQHLRIASTTVPTKHIDKNGVNFIPLGVLLGSRLGTEILLASLCILNQKNSQFAVFPLSFHGSTSLWALADFSVLNPIHSR
jgi:hypothetical protein